MTRSDALSKSSPGKRESHPMTQLLAGYMEAHNFASIMAAAEHLGVSRTTLYSALNSETPNMNMDTLGRLARGFGMPTHLLMYALNPALPGAEGMQAELERYRSDETRNKRKAALSALREMSQGLPSSRAFLETRQEESGA